MNLAKMSFDRQNYSKRSIDTFEVISSYFVDIYYNYLYTEAKKLKMSGKTNNITEGYKHALNAYKQGIENPNTFKDTLKGISNFFDSCGFTGLSFTNCIERITEEFIPKDYYESVSKQQKISILKSVISESNINFIEKIVRKFLSHIIDNHNDMDNIRVLQDEFIDILIIEKERLYHKFIAKDGGGKNSDNAIKELMQNEIKELYKKNYDLSKTIIDLKKYIQKIRTELDTGKNLNISLTHKIKELENKVTELDNELTGYKSSIYIDENSIIPPTQSIQPFSTEDHQPNIIELKNNIETPDQEYHQNKDNGPEDINDISSGLNSIISQGNPDDDSFKEMISKSLLKDMY